ncbi:MAG TPA: FAD-binding oxidoreductase [Actinoplanes sp.]|jgi:FAD/FMN-containing dehydrogenase|nr:FAD-binding oxidoreductase [Actinoplanes sp.]
MTTTGFSGDIIGPDAAEYPAASRTMLVTGSPALILRPAGVADVQAAIRLNAGRHLSVRGGGHSFAGFGTNDGGVVIDLSRLAEVSVIDKDRHIVRIGGGATWGQVATALAPHNLAISSGDTRSVGVGGLTLTGGIGWKVRKYGLALDSLVAAELVTASGEVVRADAGENAELFWALRGGGGNFGIVTAFEFAAHPTTDVFHGRIAFPAAEAGAVLQGWADYMRTAPEDLTAIASFANPFAGGAEAPVEVHVVIDSDDPALAAEALDPIRALGTVIADEVVLKAYADVLVDGMVPPPGVRFVSRGVFVDEESVPDALRVLVEIGASGQSPAIAIRSVGGAVARVPGDATAYAHRQAELMVMTGTVNQEQTATRDRLEPYVSGAYANFLSSATDADVRAVYPPETYRRLAAVKREYDPGNLFAGNHNVRP